MCSWERTGVLLANQVCVLVSQLCPTLCDPIDCSLQAPLSMGFSRRESWSGLPCPSPGDLPDPGIEPESLTSPALAGRLKQIHMISWSLEKNQKQYSGTKIVFSANGTGSTGHHMQKSESQYRPYTFHKH